MISHDFVFNDDGDLKIENGDLAVEQSDGFHIQDIIQASPGQFYQSLLLGYGITSKVHSMSSKLSEKGLLREALTLDNYSVKTIKFIRGVVDELVIEVEADKIK